MHPKTTVDEARRLARRGLRPGTIARRLGLPEPTVTHRVRGDRRGPRADGRDEVCPRCQGAPLDEQQYSYLLGAHLGDGHISVGRRGVASLSVSCGDAWPGVASEVRRALQGVMPSSSVCCVARPASHHRPNSTGDSDQTVYGYYTNRFERTPSGWRIAGLKLTVLWMTGNFGIFGNALAPRG
jgi:hypothetical protein